MKSNKVLLLAIAAVASSGLAGCGNGDVDSSRVQEAIAAAEQMTQDELFEAAANELGASGQVKIAGTTSRGGKDAVKNLYISKLQEYNESITDPLVYDTFVDGVIYETLIAEITAGSGTGYSGTIIQDGYQLQTKGIDTGYFQNYTPKDWSEAEGTDDDADADPMTLQYNFKTWFYNNKNGDMVIDNVWDVTHTQYQGKIDTMNPNNENVNMDWLIQLTDDDEVAKLKAAYEDSSNSSDVDIADYSDYGDKAYAYAFIDRFIKNAVFYADDGGAMSKLASTPGDIGWIVYSKILNVSESTDISKKNLVVAALGEDNTDGATIGESKMKGFAGFMYKHYLQIMPDAQYPYATMAFFDLISTNADAYSVWGNDVGDYPTLPSINQDRTENGNGTLDGTEFTQSDDGETVFPCLNDPTSDWWLDEGEAIVETPSFIGAHYDEVIDYIDACIAAK